MRTPTSLKGHPLHPILVALPIGLFGLFAQYKQNSRAPARALLSPSCSFSPSTSATAHLRALIGDNQQAFSSTSLE